MFDIDCLNVFVFDIDCLDVFVFNICNQGRTQDVLRKMYEIVFDIFFGCVLTFTACEPLRLSEGWK